MTEIEQLRRWKAEASNVMEDLRQAWISAGRPGPPGMSMARAMAHEIERLRQALGEVTPLVPCWNCGNNEVGRTMCPICRGSGYQTKRNEASE